MRLSTFNLYVEDYPEPGSVLVNNTFSGAFAVLDADELAALRAIDAGESPPPSFELDSDLADPDVGIVVADLASEEAEFAAWFERRRRMGRRLDTIIGVNLACNFACSYCSQEGVLDGTVMSPELIERTAQWLAERAIEADLDGVYITFVGGEPLLHVDRIERCARRVRELLGGRAFSFGLITNGYFLDEQVLDRLIPLGLERAQITLDGNGDTHCHTRVSKKGEDTFARIFDHTIAASRRISVRVNGNYQADTLHGFAPLIDALVDAGFPAGSSITFSPALEGLSSAEGAGTGSCTWSDADTKYQVALQDRVRARGYDPGGPLNAVGPCELHDAHHYSIDPRGDIHKCPGFMGHRSWSIGHVTSGLTSEYERFMTLTPKQACGGCAHRPNCGGGCLATEWLRTNNTEGVNCAHDYFEEVTPDAVIRQYLTAVSETPGEALAQFPETVALPGAPPTYRERRKRSPSLRVVAA